eukprot:1264865-Alexandrium_andersonii.AAC.1
MLPSAARSLMQPPSSPAACARPWALVSTTVTRVWRRWLVSTVCWSPGLRLLWAMGHRSSNGPARVGRAPASALRRIC